MRNKARGKTYNKEEREKEKQSGDMEVNEVQVQLDKMKAETKVRLAALKQESKVRVQTLNADGNLEVTKLAAEKERVLKDLHARAVSEAAQVMRLHCTATAARSPLPLRLLPDPPPASPPPARPHLLPSLPPRAA